LNVLELDHVNNDGNAHRRELGGSGERIFKWAIKNGFPPTLQILCANCHKVKTRTGDCSYRREMGARRPNGQPVATEEPAPKLD
jgi:hypothetical protein